MQPFNVTTQCRKVMQAAALSVLACSTLVFCGVSDAQQPAPVPAASVDVSLKPQYPGSAIPRSFLGLSIEWGLIQRVITPEHDRQKTMVRLMQMLRAYNGPLVIRIGGNSQDEATYDLPSHKDLPKFVHVNISHQTLELLAELASKTGCKYIIGINLADDRPDLARELVEQSQRVIGAKNILAYEFGNEPDFLNRLGKVFEPDTFDNYLARWTKYYKAVRPLLSDAAKIAGPASGGGSFHSHFGWYRDIPYFIVREHARLSVVALHRYPLGAPTKDPNSPIFTDIANLLKDSSSTSFADQTRYAVAAASPYHLPVRFSELNSAAGGGKKNVSDTFASTLWGADTMFEIASAGGAGVNFHMSQGADNQAGSYDALAIGTDGSLTVEPLFYAMWMFARASQKDAHFIPVVFQATVGYRQNVNVKIWATEDENHVVRMVILNKNLHQDANVRIDLPDYGEGQVVRLQAPHADSKAHVVFGGQTYSESKSGEPSDLKTPSEREAVKVVNGRYLLDVDHVSAAMIVFRPK